MADDLSDLKRVARTYHRKRDEFRTAQAFLYEAIRKAGKEGHTTRAIAQVAGVSFQRVHQLLESPDA